MYSEKDFSFQKTHHNIVEFWHKTNFLHQVEVDSIEIKSHESDMFYKYQSFYNKKNSIKSQIRYSSEGGNFKIKCTKTENMKNLLNVKINLQKTYQNFAMIDAVLYNKHSKFWHLELVGIGINNYHFDSLSGITSVSGYYIKQKF